MRTINEHYLTITGKSCIPEKLNLAHDVKIEVEATITSATAKDNSDGTIDMYYRAKQISALITTDKGETIKSIDKRKQSQRLRFGIKAIQEDIGNTEEIEDFYEKVMGYILGNLEELISKVK